MSMTLKLGYAVSTLIFLGFFLVTLTAEVRAKKYHPFLYRSVVVATTTVGTTSSDFLDRTLGLGYVKSSIILFCGVLVVLFIWRRVTGRIEFEHVTTRSNEAFYWITILVSNTLGTALGDLSRRPASASFALARLWRSHRARRGRAFFHPNPEKRALLVRIRSDTPSRRDSRRHADQAARRGWSRAQPH